MHNSNVYYQNNYNGYYNNYLQSVQMNALSPQINLAMASPSSSVSDGNASALPLLRTGEASVYGWSSPYGSNTHNFQGTTPQSTTVTSSFIEPGLHQNYTQKESFVNGSNDTKDYQAPSIGPLYPAEKSRSLMNVKRVKYSARQIKQLENVFPHYNNRRDSKCPEIIEILDNLVKHAGVSKQQAKNWFRNKRFKIRQENQLIDTMNVPHWRLSPNGCVCCYNVYPSDAGENDLERKPTATELQILENVYEKQVYIAQKPDIIKELIEKTQLPRDVIVDWFQKKRDAERKSKSKPDVKEMENIAYNVWREKMEKIDKIDKIDSIEKRLEDQNKIIQSFGNIRVPQAPNMGVPDKVIYMPVDQFTNRQLAQGQAVFSTLQAHNYTAPLQNRNYTAPLQNHNYTASTYIPTPLNYQQVPNCASATSYTSYFGNSVESYSPIVNQALPQVINYEENYDIYFKKALEDLLADTNIDSIKYDWSFDLSLLD